MTSNIFTALTENVSDALYNKTNLSRRDADEKALVAVDTVVEALIGLAADDLTVADLIVVLGLAEDPYVHAPEAEAPVATEETPVEAAPEAE